jgi:PqqD family protein of HPr-rel-A system
MILHSSWLEGRWFDFKEWEADDTVVYDTASGDTHVVDAVSIELLNLLRQNPGLSTESLVADLRKVFDAELDAEIAARVECGLARLQRIGLIAARPR